VPNCHVISSTLSPVLFGITAGEKGDIDPDLEESKVRETMLPNTTPPDEGISWVEAEEINRDL
jgi:hypothetical protein